MRNNEVEKFELFEEQPTGPLSTRHKILLRTMGHILIWLGKAFINAETYERVNQVCKGMNEKAERLQELSDKMDNLSTEELKRLAETVKDAG